MNKYKTFILIMFFLLVFCISKVDATIKDYTLLGKYIYLDAGHGGIDSGAVKNNIYEKDINLILVKKLEQELISRGSGVYLIRDGDYDLATSNIRRKRSDLYNRANLIDNSNCDMYISIHLNSTTESKWRGVQLFYNTNNEENKKIANTINEELKKHFSYIREIKEENNYYMYKNIYKPGILIEAGFLSNPSDNYLLRDKDYQDKIVDIIASGIENYFLK